VAVRHRVRLSGCGPIVSKETNDLLELWRASYGVPIGRSIDCLVKQLKESPQFRLYLEGRQPGQKS